MIKGTYRASDLSSASWVHLRPGRGFAIIGSVVAMLYVAAFWLLFFGRGAAAMELSWVRWVLPGSGIYLGALFGLGIPYRARKSFRQRKDLQRECAFVPSDAGLASSAPNAQGLKPWDDYLKWKEGKRVFLVYLSDNMYQLIPKRFFESEAEISSFRAMLSAKIARQVR